MTDQEMNNFAKFTHSLSTSRMQEFGIFNSSTITSHPLILLLTPRRLVKTQALPFFPCLRSKPGNSRRTPLSPSTENFYVIDYKWDNKSSHHFIGSGVKITCLHLHIMLQFIPLYTCRLASSPSSSPHDLWLTYGWIPGCFSLDHWCFDLNVSGWRPHA